MQYVRISKSGRTKWYKAPDGTEWDKEKIKELSSPRITKTDDGLDPIIPASLASVWTARVCRDGTLMIEGLNSKRANLLAEKLLKAATD